LEEYVLVAALAVTAGMLLYQIIMRFVFNNTPSWTEESARYLFIWMTWMGTCAALKDGKHIRVELISSALIRRNRLIPKNVLEILVLLMWLCFSVFLAVSGFQLAYELAGRNAVSASMRIPLQFTYGAVPVSCGIVTLRLVRLIVLEFRKLLKGGAA
jgi:TRAP-type C4-dicarboxylate transport system permease small subunit